MKLQGAALLFVAIGIKGLFYYSSPHLVQAFAPKQTVSVIQGRTRIIQDQPSDDVVVVSSIPRLEVSPSPVDELSEERKTRLFQYLLRDFQIEGTPLLSVDVTDVQTMQAALWTTLAELSEQQDQSENKAVLIFENMPIDTLRSWVDHFTSIQSQQQHITRLLPDLQRFHVSLVGKGVGPAILVETQNATDDDTTTTTTTTVSENAVSSDDAEDEEEEQMLLKYQAAMKAFVNRMIITSFPDIAHPLYSQNVSSPSMLIRSTIVRGGREAQQQQQQQHVCHILSSFWNCICELSTITSPETESKSIMLLLPNDIEEKEEDEERTGKENKKQDVSSSTTESSVFSSSSSWARFVAVSELLSQSLSLFPPTGHNNDYYSLSFFHPHYNRDDVLPQDKVAIGHIPPKSWLSALLDQQQQQGDKHVVSSTSEERHCVLQAYDYQRRSPIPAVLIKRCTSLRESNVEEGEEEDGWVELFMDNGTQTTLSRRTVERYTQSALELSTKGLAQLQDELQSERNIFYMNSKMNC